MISMASEGLMWKDGRWWREKEALPRFERSLSAFRGSERREGFSNGPIQRYVQCKMISLILTVAVTKQFFCLCCRNRVDISRCGVSFIVNIYTARKIFCFVLPQLCNDSVWAPVFVTGCASWGDNGAGSPPRQEHYGLSAVALGNPFLYEHQHSEGHKEQPFNPSSPGY
ncbi:hypothetical protein GOODEAATRI_013462 [Goodea atripinnis]|uniref:Uncharacterized protein n=1 Tax=Goodea atripinnis TaxID=208336 RepID=A0ABV0NLH4_9TELE